jgi:hypothetical protein
MQTKEKSDNISNASTHMEREGEREREREREIKKDLENHI